MDALDFLTLSDKKCGCGGLHCGSRMMKALEVKALESVYQMAEDKDEQWFREASKLWAESRRLRGDP